jgi:predicted RND superfamily exporter protein
MTQPSFLARKTFGWPNYFWIAMAFALFVALIPRAAREARDSNTNKAEDWLPSNYPESTDLRWFREHFLGEGFILVTWDGCTLGNQEKMNLLLEKLSERLQPVTQMMYGGLRGRITHHTGKWFRKIITGPSMIEELTQPPLSLGYAEAVRRLDGALVGPLSAAEGDSPDDSARTTALVVYLAPEGYENNRAMRRVVDEVARVAVQECGIPPENLHMGGPIVDNVAIDRAGESSLARLAGLSGIVGLSIAYWCFRNARLTAAVVAVGAISAVLSLAIVFYFGVFEVLVLGLPTPVYGAMDAVLMSMPALVYVLGVSGAIHFVNYYRDVRATSGVEGAVERAVRLAWLPCGLVALTAAVGFGSLITSDIVPIRKFGGFSAVAILASLCVLFTMLPVYLHRFPPAWIGRKKWEDISEDDEKLPPWAMACCRWITQHHALVTWSLMALMGLFALGTFRLESSVQLLKLLDKDADLVQDYTWVEEHLGNLVPMEVVLTVPSEQCRSGDEHAEANGQQYRMTFLERLGMVRRVLARVEDLDAVSRTLSAATLAPNESQQTSAAARRAEDYTTNKNLEENANSFRDYRQMERLMDGKPTPDSRELWRISARVTALRDIDYGQFTNELRKQVEPVLLAYRRRDELVRSLHEADKRLEGARLCILFRGELSDTQPQDDSAEAILGDLLGESGLADRVDDRKGGLVFFNVAQLDNRDLTSESRAQIMKVFGAQEGVLVISPQLEPVAQDIAREGAAIINLTTPLVPPEKVIAPLAQMAGAHVVDALYTGIIPLVFKTQGQLISSLQQSLFTSSLLILAVMSIVLRSVFAGAVSMLPNLFPVILVFGSLGLLGIKMEIGIIMTASVALGVAVDTTIHFVTWFFHGQSEGLDRQGSTMLAYERCGVAMVQGAMISGLGLAVFAFSSFTPTRQFGYLMITIQATALLGDLVFLPALLCGRLGRFFERFHERHLAKPKNAETDDKGLTHAAAKGADLGQATDALPGTRTLTPSKGKEREVSQREDSSSRSLLPHAQGAGDNDLLVSPDLNALRDKLRSFRRS